MLARQLQEFVKSQIAPYKYPRAIEFVTALPRTLTGKLQRFRLRQEAREEAVDAEAGALCTPFTSRTDGLVLSATRTP